MAVEVAGLAVGFTVTSGVSAAFSRSVADSKNPFSTGLLACFKSFKDTADFLSYLIDF